MSAVTWLGCDLVSGRIIEELPNLAPSGSISAVLGTYTSASFRLPVPLAGRGALPRNWEAATEPGRTMIVALLAGQPIWAGVVLIRQGGTGATVDLACTSLEGYLDRRFVRDHTFKQVDEAAIAAGLADDAGPNGIGFLVDAPNTGTKRDRTYADKEDKTVYSALRELMGVDGGPEWTISLAWTSAAQTAVAKVLQVRKRVGFATSTPNAVFMAGATRETSSAVYTLREDYSSGNGANYVVATSSPEGVPKRSAPASNITAGWPRFDLRFTPSTSITDQATLDAHARAALAITLRGASSLTITARADAYPVLGTDFFIGDDVGYELVGHRHPAGLAGVGRAVGWDLDPQANTLSPILYAPGSAE